MYLDVLDLKAFYYRSALGRAVQQALRVQMEELWPDAKGQTVAGFGFALPLLRPYLEDAERVVALMPGPQGVMSWPSKQSGGKGNVAVLCEETAWPIATGQVDKLVLLHGLESSEQPADVLSEAYRVLGPGGRAIFIVPNRAGLWARRDRTPFGYGRPYSLVQLEAQIKAYGFAPERYLSALYRPPSTNRFWRKAAGWMEYLGREMPVFKAGGVFLLEASKQIPAPKRPGLPQTVRESLKEIGLAQPSPKPARVPQR
ncbi:MAG: methyltransferase domain-containing protein [Pseudomonadota bacterium]